jgi:hypothetical protein
LQIQYIPRCNAAVGAINGPRFHDAMFPSLRICVNLSAAAAYLVCDSNQKQGITSKSDGLARRRAAFLMHWILKLLMQKHEASRMGLSDARRPSGESQAKNRRG